MAAVRRPQQEAEVQRWSAITGAEDVPVPDSPPQTSAQYAGSVADRLDEFRQEIEWETGPPPGALL